MSIARRVVALVVGSLWVACAGGQEFPTQSSTYPLGYPSGESREGLVSNGSFAADLTTNWNVVIGMNDGNGLLNVPPVDHNDLRLSTSASDFRASTARLSGAALSLVPSMLTSSAQLRVPYRSQACAVVNQDGNGMRASAIEQNVSFSLSDLDSFDHKPRLRAIIAPVMSYNANHTIGESSYVFAHLDNLSTSTEGMASFYLYAGAPGLLWKNDNGFTYYGWQLVELTPSIANLSLGDSVRFGLWSAGCSKRGHYSTTYVDSVGDAAKQGTSVVIYGPDYVRAGGNVQYDVRVRQDGAASVGNTVVSIVLPSDVLFSSFAAPSTWSCQTPSVGQTGYIVCQLPTLEAGDVVEVPLFGTVAASAGGVLAFGTYGVVSGSLPALLGPRVMTNVTNANQKLSNLTVTAQQSTVNDSNTQTDVTVVIGNNGEAAANGAQLTDYIGAGMSGARYACVAGAGAQCGGKSTASGTGSLSLTADVNVNAIITCTVTLQKDNHSGVAPYGVVVKPATGRIDAVSYDSEAVALVNLASAHLASDGPAVDGTACKAGTDCKSGFCVDGVCCDTSCEGACYACNVTGSTGTCTILDGVEPRPGHPSCGPYVCVAGACLSACETDTACVASYECDAHLCQPVRDVCRADADCPPDRICTPAHTCESERTQDPAHPSWKMLGSGCRYEDGPPAMLAMLFAAVAWARRRSKRAGTMAIVVLGTCIHIASARAADNSANIPTNRFLPLGGAEDVFGTASPSVNHTFDASFKLWANYARSPLRLVTTAAPTARQDIVHHQATLDVTGSLALPLRLELGVALPIVMQQADNAIYVSRSLAQHRLQVSLGDLRLTPKWGFFQGDLIRIGIGVFISAPTGRRGEYVSLGGASFTPTALVELGARQGLRLLLNVGALLRPARNIADVRLRHALSWSAAAVLPKQLSSTGHIQVAAGVFGESNLRKGQPYATPVEVLATLGYGTRSGWSVEAGGGAGVTNGVGAPRWRVLLGVGYTHRPQNSTAAPPPEAMGPPVPPPAPPPVAAPVVAHKVNVLPEEKAAPSDRDHDGIIDDEDACPDVPGPATGARPGCPPRAELPGLLDGIRLVTFKTNSADIEGENAALLERVRQMLEANPDVRLAIDGHTDDSGAADVNEFLSMRRAQAAALWLEQHGIDRRRLEAKGFGSAEPVDPGQTLEARKKNRRVAFRILAANRKASSAPGKAKQEPAGDAAKTSDDEKK